MTRSDTRDDICMHRRQWLRVASGGAAGAWATSVGATVGAAERGQATIVHPTGRLKQSLVQWCYADYWNLDQLCEVAKKLGCSSVELVEPEDWPTLARHGLQCAISPSHLFVQGMNNPRYQDGCVEILKRRIDQCADAGVKTVITFTGYADESGEWNGGQNPDLSQLPTGRRRIDADEGSRNCVNGFKRIVGYAEKKQVNLAIELLNTRVHDHPMKGHPGYQGDHVDYCLDIIRQVGSPRLGLLFDVYHVQIMDGDIIRRIRQCGEAIKHVHTAGNPGRCELDENQEINYPPIMKALADIGFAGFVGHEFIPTRDPLAGLAQAVKLCDV